MDYFAFEVQDMDNLIRRETLEKFALAQSPNPRSPKLTKNANKKKQQEPQSPMVDLQALPNVSYYGVTINHLSFLEASSKLATYSVFTNTP
jgi:hypothetical protein